MRMISAADFQRHFARYQNEALKTPLAITSSGREHLILLSAEEYHRMKRQGRQVMGLDDFTPADLNAILQAEPPQEAAAFDHECDT